LNTRSAICPLLRFATMMAILPRRCRRTFSTVIFPKLHFSTTWRDTVWNNPGHSCVTIYSLKAEMKRINMGSFLALWLNRVILALAVGVVLFGVGWLVTVAYVIHTRRGPLNSSGGQPPTACTEQTAQQDCQKLKCVSHVWYCDEHGTPICFQGKCLCFYGCL
jgi:hypothetical protein